MVDAGNDVSPWLRPTLRPGVRGNRAEGTETFERAGQVVRTDRSLNEIVQRRPPGVTAHQWNCASRTRFDFVVCDARTHAPVFAVEFDDPCRHTVETPRNRRMKTAVWEAVGIEVLCIESPTLRPATHGRWIVEYVIDARAYGAGASDGDEAVDAFSPAPLSYRDIIGRLPDGRTGFVNDLGAVARAAAIDAYVSRQLADPIVRGLHVTWQSGPAEGWAWLAAREKNYLFERTRIWQHRFSCGVDPARLAEDLATAAIGERLKRLATDEPTLYDRHHLGRELDELRRRGAEIDGGFTFDHVSFD